MLPQSMPSIVQVLEAQGDTIPVVDDRDVPDNTWDLNEDCTFEDDISFQTPSRSQLLGHALHEGPNAGLLHRTTIC
jgi:hypothetical protein